jgi:DNA adenine methylase
MIKTRSFLKWAGSKFNCLHEITSNLPPGKRLVEPFAGSAVVCMNTHYSSYLLAESNPDLVDLFQTLQKKGEPFINQCASYFQPEFNVDEQYYALRADFNTLERSEKKSALFLYLNRHGYNGLCRYNSKGGFNVPFGLFKKPYFPREEMLYFREKCKEVVFQCRDFRETFGMLKKGDVVYCDPPYVAATKTGKKFNYTQQLFSDEDQVELAELAKKTSAKGIPVLISNHDTPFTRDHYQGAQLISFPVSRWISCAVADRKPVNELLAIFMP